MKKSYKLFLSLILLLPAFTGFSQEYLLKSNISPALGAAGSRFSVTATVMDNDAWCRVEWPDPVGNSLELAYDDGEADDLFVYSNPGGINALKFIPYYDSYIVTGGSIYVGDGNFPGPFLGTSFRVLVYDDDGEGGLPGTALDSMDVTVENYEWVEFEGLTAEISEGNFYLAMKQLAPAPDAAPVGVDTDNPTYFNSYSLFQGGPGWVLCPLQDLMIRAFITGYNEPSRSIDSFEVARFSGFEIYESPLVGDTTILDTLSMSEYDDYYWDTLQAGLYAYGVKTHFTGGEWSDYDVSNPVVHVYYSSPPSCFYQADTGNMPLIGCTPMDINGDVPFNFLGLNLYQDMALVEYFPYWPNPYEYIEYLPQELQPGIYNFNLTAVYDLTPFGFPGETGESGFLWTDVVIRYGYPLPFLEPWNLGTFETNNWLTDGENWSVNGNEGNPSPSAQFTWDPIQTDYSIALESFPLLADSITEGQIYLDFDLMLDNFNPTGTEEMLVQVWNWESQEWGTVSTYSNIDGSFDWTSEHLDITSLTMETVFKIRFLSVGESSLNIVGWYVDNIHVYRDCKAPQELEAYLNYSPFGMQLDWEAPDGTPSDQWIHWDDGEVSGNSIFAGYDWAVAARWTPDQLTDFEGATITQIAFVPGPGPALYRVRVWSGEQGANLLIDQEVIDPVLDQWNLITLNTPVPIDITQELWVGYHIHNDTGYPAGCDDGPAIDGYGNWLYWSSWQTLLEVNPELDFNWSIQAFIEQAITDDTIVKYAIYRSDNSMPYYLRDYTEQTYYLDDSSICEPLGSTHFYKITALYINENDTCESGFSNEAGDICEGVDDEDISSILKIYPNPASDLLFIESSEEKIEFVTVYDGRGERVKRRKGEGVKMELQVNDLAPGLYLVKVNLGDEIISRKIIVKH